jgi:hypothetical protein
LPTNFSERAWLLALLLVSVVMGLAVCQGARAASSALPPCTGASCPPVTVSIPPPPPPPPSHPKVWAGFTRGEAISEYETLLYYPIDIPVKAVHALCHTYRAWKVWSPKHPGLYIIDERSKGYFAGYVGDRSLGCSP